MSKRLPRFRAENRSTARIRAWSAALAGQAHNAWVLENQRLALRYDRLGFVIQSLLHSVLAPDHLHSWLQAGSLKNSENRL